MSEGRGYHCSCYTPALLFCNIMASSDFTTLSKFMTSYLSFKTCSMLFLLWVSNWLFLVEVFNFNFIVIRAVIVFYFSLYCSVVVVVSCCKINTLKTSSSYHNLQHYLLFRFGHYISCSKMFLYYYFVEHLSVEWKWSSLRWLCSTIIVLPARFSNYCTLYLLLWLYIFQHIKYK